MKREELMINDWVSLDGEPIQVAGLQGRKVGVHKRRRSIYCSWHLDSEFQPIRLTSEILVKNGFKHSMPHNDWTNADCNFFLYEGGNGFRVQNTDIKLDYVHQFQHTLRLCGIKKEIEL